jgi:hypothetical protein
LGEYYARDVVWSSLGLNEFIQLLYRQKTPKPSSDCSKNAHRVKMILVHIKITIRDGSADKMTINQNIFVALSQKFEQTNPKSPKFVQIWLAHSASASNVCHR